MKKIAKRLFEKSGTSLVELLIYMGLLLVLIAIFTQIFSAMVETRLETEANSYINQDYAYILARLQYDIRRADSIATPVSEGNTSTLLVMNIDGTSYTYTVSGGNLTLTDGTGTDNLISSETTISDVLFTRLGNAGGKPKVFAQMVLTSRASRTKGKETLNLNITAGLR